ncbi:MAG: dipeptidase PepE [Acidobacteriota bacterium]
MRKLLLISSSRTHGTGYLDHCAEALRECFQGASTVFFVPYAQQDRDGYAKLARERFEALGFSLVSAHEVESPSQAGAAAEAIFIGGGNTFGLLTDLYRSGLVPVLRRRVLEEGIPYAGTSAGSNVACVSIRTTNDMPIVYPPSFDALGLVPFNINPHYLDPDPGSTHQGETRETRIREFHELNTPPVLGLREGTMFRVRGDEGVLLGSPGGRLFQRGEAAREVRDGEALDFLLD